MKLELNRNQYFVTAGELQGLLERFSEDMPILVAGRNGVLQIREQGRYLNLDGQINTQGTTDFTVFPGEGYMDF